MVSPLQNDLIVFTPIEHQPDIYLFCFAGCMQSMLSGASKIFSANSYKGNAHLNYETDKTV